MKRQRDVRGIRLKKGDTARARGVSTPPMHERKRSYRAHCKAMAAGGMGNTAAGVWVKLDKSHPSIEGAQLRGGATRSAVRPHWEFFEKKMASG